MDELTAIRAREQAATPGPWDVGEHTYDGWGGTVRMIDIGSAFSVAEYYIEPPDVAFIAHARTDIPTLLALVDTRTAQRDRYREAIYTYFRAHDEAASRAEQSAARHALWAVLDTEE